MHVLPTRSEEDHPLQERQGTALLTITSILSNKACQPILSHYCPNRSVRYFPCHAGSEIPQKINLKCQLGLEALSSFPWEFLAALRAQTLCYVSGLILHAASLRSRTPSQISSCEYTAQDTLGLVSKQGVPCFALLKALNSKCLLSC